MQTVDTEGMQMFLSFSDIFDNKELPEMEKEIKNFNMHKAISIIVELISIRNKTYPPQKAFGVEIKLPSQSIIKKFMMDGLKNEKIVDELSLSDGNCIVALQPLLLLLKEFIIYGNYNSLNDTDYKITKEDYKKIIELELIEIENLNKKHSKQIDMDHYLYSTYHLNNIRNFSGEYARMYYMMNICKDDSFLPEENKNEFRDYYNDFLNKYGFTVLDYIFLLFIENILYFRELHYDTFSYTSLWKSIKSVYKGRGNQALYEKIIKTISLPISEFKEWAVESREYEWDFSKFFSFPLITDNNNNYISISDVTTSNAFYEKLFWMIRDCYPDDDSRAMAFFGRLFEHYIQTLTEESTKINEYNYIKEFSYTSGRNRKLSSDSYIRKGNNLLAIEAKGFSVLQICMTRNKNVEYNYEKLFIKPILQADSCLSETLKTNSDFFGIQNVYIISVTMDNINAVPSYYDTIHKTINKKKRCSQTKYLFNLSIEEYEQLMYVLEKGHDIFKLLKNYYEDNKLAPFSTYIQRNYPEIKMPSFTEKYFKEASEKLKETIFEC